MQELEVKSKGNFSRFWGFWNKRIMSFLGVIPLGVYVILHLWTNMSSLGGPDVFNVAVQGPSALNPTLPQSRHPIFLVLEILLCLAILIHLVIGVRLILRWRPNLARVRSFGNLKFALQRISGLGLMLFIVAHVIQARIRPALHGGVETFCGMRHAYFEEPLTLPVYILGLLGISFHLANGIWSAGLTWGITVTPQRQKIWERFSFFVFVILLTMAVISIYGFMQSWNPAWTTHTETALAKSLCLSK